MNIVFMVVCCVINGVVILFGCVFIVFDIFVECDFVCGIFIELEI